MGSVFKACSSSREVSGSSRRHKEPEGLLSRVEGIRDRKENANLEKEY